MAESLKNLAFKHPAIVAPLRPEQLAFAIMLLLLAGMFFAGVVHAGRHLLIADYLWPPDLLFGSDIERNLRDMSEPGYRGRSNVHPLFAPVAKPFGLLIQSLGATAGMSAILLNAAAGALGLVLLAVYLRCRGVQRFDAVLAVLLMASSATWLIQSALPGTYIFSLCVIAVSHLLLIWTLRRPAESVSAACRWGREALWLATGVLNYGFTVTNGFLSFLSYGFSRRGVGGWLRAGVFGLVVLALGFAATLLVGSSINLWTERLWIVDETMRGPAMDHPFGHSLSVAAVWSQVLPTPELVRTTDERAWLILTVLHWRYAPGGAALAIAWCAILLTAAWAAWRDPATDGRRLTAALLAGFFFHVVLHTFYGVTYEGVFAFSSHSLFMLSGFLAPLWARVGNLPPTWRWGCRAGVFAFASILAIRHFALLGSLDRLVPLPPG